MQLACEPEPVSQLVEFDAGAGYLENSSDADLRVINTSALQDVMAIGKSIGHQTREINESRWNVTYPLKVYALRVFYINVHVQYNRTEFT